MNKDESTTKPIPMPEGVTMAPPKPGGSPPPGVPGGPVPGASMGSTAPSPGAPPQPSSILDNSSAVGQPPAPYKVDDAVSSGAEVKLLGGAIDNDGLEPVRLYRVLLWDLTGLEVYTHTHGRIEPATRFSRVISNCMERVGDDDGHWVTDPRKMPGLFDEFTIADRTLLLLNLRIISVDDGDWFKFLANCPQCGAENSLKVNLTELERKEMDDPMERMYDVVLPSSGHKARCQIMLGKHEGVVAKAQEARRDLLSAALLARVVELNGRPTRIADLKALSLRDRNALRSQFEAREGGIDTSVENTCGSCGAGFEADLDITQKGFFFPSETSEN
jgi:hypothetical protein